MLLEEWLSTVLPEYSLMFPVDLGLLNHAGGLFHIRFYVSRKWVMHYVSAAQIYTAIMSGAHWLMCRKSERFVFNETETTQGCLHRRDWWHFAPLFTAPSMGKTCDNDLYPPQLPGQSWVTWPADQKYKTFECENVTVIARISVCVCVCEQQATDWKCSKKQFHFLD